MNDNYDYERTWDDLDAAADRRQEERAGFEWFDSLRDLWRWDELAAEVGQESQARFAIVGLPQAGKRLLFNRLRGWDSAEQETAGSPAAAPAAARQEEEEDALMALEAWREEVVVESYGFFVLADLPAERPVSVAAGESLMMQLGEPALVLYLLDAQMGVRPADYRWIATLRAAGRPLVVALNKADVMRHTEPAVAEATRRLGMPVIPISAYTGLNVESLLLPALLDAAPRLAVPLGREMLCLRRTAARRVMRQAALLAGMMGAQPAPLLDLPFQAMLQVGVVMRIGAAYGHAPGGGLSREVLGAVISALGLRYLGMNLVRLVPLLGWAAAGLLSSGATCLIGEAAIRYYEAGGVLPFGRFVDRPAARGLWLPGRRWTVRARNEVQVVSLVDVEDETGVEMPAAAEGSHDE